MSIDFSNNYFQIFQLPETYRLDAVLLENCYQKLQRLVHPDRFVSGTDQERHLALQQSSYINEAYQTLRQPLQRAKYLAKLVLAEAAPKDHETINDLEFLEQQIEWREQLQTIKDSGKNTLDQLSEKLTRMDDEITAKIESLFEKVNLDSMQEAILWINRWQFCNKFKLEIEMIEEEFLG